MSVISAENVPLSIVLCYLLTQTIKAFGKISILNTSIRQEWVRQGLPFYILHHHSRYSHNHFVLWNLPFCVKVKLKRITFLTFIVLFYWVFTLFTFINFFYILRILLLSTAINSFFSAKYVLQSLASCIFFRNNWY